MSAYKVTKVRSGYRVIPDTRPDGLPSVYDRRDDADRRAKFLNFMATYQPLSVPA